MPERWIEKRSYQQTVKLLSSLWELRMENDESLFLWLNSLSRFFVLPRDGPRCFSLKSGEYSYGDIHFKLEREDVVACCATIFM
eukprot:scaffold2438_cov167-Amphora_coffeaeformis.AAC.10